jgi:hypothetical protein
MVSLLASPEYIGEEVVLGSWLGAGPVHPAYNPYFSACFFFSRNSIFLSQQISQQCFLASLSAQPTVYSEN